MHKRRLYRHSAGHVSIELAMLSVLFTVFAIFSLDVAFIVLGSQMNDATCRDAARVAAQGSDYATSLALAKTAVAAHTPAASFIGQPTLNVSQFVYQDFSGRPPANTSPFVTAVTSTSVRIPAPVFFMGASFGANGTFLFSKSYTFPIVKTTLYL